MKEGILKTYSVIQVCRPDKPNIRRWILPDEKKIYVNMAALNGKIDRLAFRKENEYGE